MPSGSKPGSFLLFEGELAGSKNIKEEGFFIKKIIAIMLAALSLLSLAASCTMQITGMMEVIARAADYAR